MGAGGLHLLLFLFLKGIYYMKKVRRILLLILLTSIIFLSSCIEGKIDTSSEYNFETDCQYYNYFAGAYYLAEGEDGYYYEENGFLRFIDKNSMESVVLCNKPECLHDQMNTNIVEELSNCNAYVGAIYDRCLHYYKGNLYALVKNYSSSQSSFARSLVRISLDGTQRKTVWDFSIGHLDLPGIPVFSTIHRGRYYTVIQENGENGSFSTILSFDLSTKKTKQIYQSDRYVGGVFALGDYLYFSCADEENTRTDIQAYCISSGKLKEEEYCKNVLPFGNQLFRYYYCMDYEKEEATHWTTTTDRNGENKQDYTLFQVGEVAPRMLKYLQCDGKNLYVRDGFDGTEIRTYDFLTGKWLATIEVPKEFQNTLHFVSCTTDGKLIIYATDNERVYQFCYCNISSIGTPEFQWYEVQKVN